MRKSKTTRFVRVCASLADVAGREYAEAVCAARAALTGERFRELARLAQQRVDFFPATFQLRLCHLLPRVGSPFSVPFSAGASGATTRAFQANTHTALAPLSAQGWFRVGECGRLFLTAKSEHYHAPLGHGFPGYALLDHARRLGIPNATHNNTRGHLTRLLEQELVRAAGGIASDDGAALGRLLAARRPATVNRVLNLETGSLAVEAALKMILARFYLPQPGWTRPVYEGRVPVFIVLGDDDGALPGNYHGTTLLTQTMRGMWPDLRSALERQDTLKVCAVRPNRLEDLEEVFCRYDRPPFKVAGLFCEPVMMNYGGRTLDARFLRRAFALCRKADAATVVDEIQTCLWSPMLFMHREYGLRPTFVAVGKGFPGGEYAASRILFQAPMDNLPQFGALVTNGQEELASLAYLVTMRWAQANTAVTSAVGEYYEERLRALAEAHADRICAVEGRRHLAALYFHALEPAKVFVSRLNDAGIDISVQTYKTDCPPSALTKLPLIAGYEVVDFVLERMEAALAWGR